jgi:1,2-diacylglycerol-3-alpha-glucose alpha-1,2-galactosyltransferase
MFSFLPSYSELFPMTILEAASCGTAIMLRDIDLYKVILEECICQ